MNYKLILKSQFKIWPQVKAMTWSERSCCVSVDPYGRPEHTYGVFIALAGLYQK